MHRRRVLATIDLGLASGRRSKAATNTLCIALGWMPVLLDGAGVSLPFGAYALMAAGGPRSSADFVV